MAKATHHGESYTAHEMNDPEPPVVIRRAMLGGEPPSPAVPEDGTDSSISSDSEETSNTLVRQNPQEPAPTMESPSSPDDSAQGSTARSTAGGGRKTGRASTKSTTSRRASTRTTDDTTEFDEFE